MGTATSLSMCTGRSGSTAQDVRTRDRRFCRGIGIFARDEGSIENFVFSNIVIDSRLHTDDWWGNGEPIHLSAVRLTKDVVLGKIRNVKFHNVICRGEAGIVVYGTDESVIENVSFDNVTLRIADFDLTCDAVKHLFFTHGGVRIEGFRDMAAPCNPGGVPSPCGTGGDSREWLEGAVSTSSGSRNKSSPGISFGRSCPGDLIGHGAPRRSPEGYIIRKPTKSEVRYCQSAI
jgi:hypothetical protein